MSELNSTWDVGIFHDAWTSIRAEALFVSKYRGSESFTNGQSGHFSAERGP